MSAELVKACLIGAGDKGRHHLRQILQSPESAEFVVISEPSERAYETTSKLFGERGLAVLPNQPDLKKLLANHGAELDAAIIVTPHMYHFEQAKACLEAGLDVLLEKPMVMNWKNRW